MSTIQKAEQKHLNHTINTLDRLIEQNKNENQMLRDGFTKDLGNRELDSLTKARKDLYFGRLDYVDDGEELSVYLGKTGAAKDHNELIIVDWRSSIGEIYNAYNGGSKKLQYTTKDGKRVNVSVKGKRQIQIEKDKVTNVGIVGSPGYDNNEILLGVLSEKGQKHQVKDIISTLQEEQDIIVRHDMTKPILVQGVAGSGKSSIALHRISFLLYKYREWMKPEKVMVIGPNKMFLSYMKKVAPELEIQNIKHNTFIGWAKERLKLKESIVEPYELLSQIINGTINLEDIELVMLFKGSMEFKDLIDRYLQTEVLQTILPKNGLFINDQAGSLDRQQLENMFLQKEHLPLNKRIDDLKASVKDWLNKAEETEIRRMKQNYDNAMHQFVYSLPESKLREQTAASLQQSFHYLKKRTEQEFRDAGTAYLSKFKKLSPISVYEGLLSEKTLAKLGEAWREEFVNALGESFWKHKRGKTLGYEDLAPLLYLELVLNGLSEEYDYLVIDEAQDMSPFQMFMLKHITKSMTILGDVSQSIYSFSGTSDWDDWFPEVYEAHQVKPIEINTSYRSTAEIMELANLVIKNSGLSVPLAIPVNRNGEQPKIEAVSSPRELQEKILLSLKRFEQQSYTKIAIICKDEHQTKGLYKYLLEQGQESIQLILDSTHELEGRIVVIPSYLVKGLEFDAVILPNVSQERFTKEALDSRLLYICLTRANHALHMYYHNEPSPLLQGAPVQHSQANEDVYGIL